MKRWFAAIAAFLGTQLVFGLLSFFPVDPAAVGTMAIFGGAALAVFIFRSFDSPPKTPRIPAGWSKDHALTALSSYQAETRVSGLQTLRALSVELSEAEKAKVNELETDPARSVRKAANELLADMRAAQLETTQRAVPPTNPDA